MLDHVLPFALHGRWHFGESITGEVGEDQAFVDLEKIDLLGFSRCGAGAHQFFPVEQGFEQGRFSDIGSARESKFRVG